MRTTTAQQPPTGRERKEPNEDLLGVEKDSTPL